MDNTKKYIPSGPGALTVLSSFIALSVYHSLKGDPSSLLLLFCGICNSLIWYLFSLRDLCWGWGCGKFHSVPLVEL